MLQVVGESLERHARSSKHGLAAKNVRIARDDAHLSHRFCAEYPQYNIST